MSFYCVDSQHFDAPLCDYWDFILQSSNALCGMSDKIIDETILYDQILTKS